MMKRLNYLIMSIALVVAVSSCAVLGQLSSLVTCKYELQNLENPKLVGVSLTNVEDINNLNPLQAMKITASLLTGKMPLSATVNVGVTNPNATAAAIQGLEWMMMFDGAKVLEGRTDRPIHISANGTGVVPFVVQIDLLDLFRKEQKDEMYRFVNGLLNVGEDNSRVTLKIRPELSVGGQNIKTGFVTLSKRL